MSNTVRAFADEAPFEEFLPHTIEIPDFGFAFDMVASSASRSIFISDSISNCLFRIQMPDVVISRWDIDQMPQSMSISPKDELVVCTRIFNYGSSELYTNSIYVYRADTVTLVNTVNLASDIVDLIHAVKLRTDNFIISYTELPDSELHLVGELSADGQAFLRTFNLQAFQMDSANSILHLAYLSVTEDGQIFALDCSSSKMLLVNPEMTEFQILESNNPNWFLRKSQMCYIQHKRQMLISHFALSKCLVAVLSLSPCDVKNRLSPAVENQDGEQDSDNMG